MKSFYQECEEPFSDTLNEDGKAAYADIRQRLEEIYKFYGPNFPLQEIQNLIFDANFTERVCYKTKLRRVQKRNGNI